MAFTKSRLTDWFGMVHQTGMYSLLLANMVLTDERSQDKHYRHALLNHTNNAIGKAEYTDMERTDGYSAKAILLSSKDSHYLPPSSGDGHLSCQHPHLPQKGEI